jgi:hypothetical protein
VKARDHPLELDLSSAPIRSRSMENASDTMLKRFIDDHAPPTHAVVLAPICRFGISAASVPRIVATSTTMPVEPDLADANVSCGLRFAAL